MIKNKANIDETILVELKKALLEKREKIQTELEVFSKKEKGIKDNYATQFEKVGDRPEENASEVEVYENNLGIEHSLEKDLLAIDEALENIANGDYGICNNCGQPQKIDIARLRAFPEAKTCIKCKKEEQK